MWDILMLGFSGILYYKTISRYHHCMLFNLTFSLSCLLFELLLYSAIYEASPTAWKLLFSSMVFTLTILIPFNMIKLKSLSSIITALVMWVIYTLSLIVDFSCRFEWVISRIGLLGSLMIAMLSGYGSIINPFNILTLPSMTSITSPDDLNHRQNHINQLIREKRKELDKIAKDEINRNWFNRIFTTSSYDEIVDEISVLEDVEGQITHEIDRMKFSKTSSRVFGYILALYCISRITMSIIKLIFSAIVTGGNVVKGSSSNSEGNATTATTGIFNAVNAINATAINAANNIDATGIIGEGEGYTMLDYYTSWWSIVSFGAIIFVSLRSFLTFVTKFCTCNKSKISSLLYAEVIGLYSMSSVLMIKSILNIHVNSNWFELVYLASTGVTIAALTMKYKLEIN